MTILLKDLEMPIRARNVAAKLGVANLDDLRKLTEADVLAVKGAGVTIWKQISETCEMFAAPVAPKTRKLPRKPSQHAKPKKRETVSVAVSDEQVRKMVAKAVDPSKVTYDALVGAFARFNETLFEGRLPPVMLVLHRKKNAHGYFWADQWKGRDGDQKVDEIALNPETMGRTVPEVLSTLVHEMTHLEQQHFGKPGKNGHHNKEWGDLMDRVGLTPRGVGKCEGKRTGRTISHDILEGGPFDLEVKAMIEEGIDLSYIANSFNVVKEKKRDRSKVKHTCPDCDANVWCKEGMHVVCGDCDRQMEEA